MSARHNLNRLERDVRAAAQDEPAGPTTDSDGDQLAREVTRAFLDELDRYQRLRTAEPQRINPADPPDGWELDSVRTRPPDQVTFGDLNRLAQADPAAAQAQWQAVKTAARDDLDTGWLAARAVEYQGGSAWERACFLAVRDRLRRAWRPRTDGEAMLIDEIAQYDVVRLWWVGVLAARSRDPLAQANRKAKSDSADDRRQSAAEATVEAGRMVERLQRLSQNAVRLLVHLRRGSSTTIFQRSGQVNVGVGQQLNVGPTTAGTAPEADGPSEDLT